MRTLGGFSSSLPDVASLAPLAAGRRLEATHVLTGTVATRDGRSAVTASLARTADGRTLWTRRFDVPADQLLDLRQPIGTAIVESLGLAPAPGTGAMSRPDVYALVAAARELTNSLELGKIEAATVLLRKALALDPEDPGANAALAIALLDRNLLEFSNEGASARHAEALERAQKALARAPGLADAHFAMGYASAGREDPEAGLAHYEAAVRLDPGRAEYWMHLADIRERTGRYADSMAALRRAVALEPFWWPAFYQSAEMAWDLGAHAESTRISERTIRGTDAFQQTMVKSDMAWRTGDLSETWRLGNRALLLAGEGQQRFARLTMGRALRAAGLMDRARQVWSFYPIDEATFDLWHGKSPPPAALAAATADIDRFWSTTAEPNLLFRSLVREGRHAELVAIYRRSGGTPAALRRRFIGLHGFLDAVPPFVIALRAAGRPDMAEALGAEARRTIDPVLAGGAVPVSLIILDSQMRVLEGDRAAALARLQEAAARGWLQARARSFPDMADEPAWQLLVGDPGFERIRAREKALVARERAEILAQSAVSAPN
jgi:tetratricopeptide (TPR) repeat protein